MNFSKPSNIRNVVSQNLNFGPKMFGILLKLISCVFGITESNGLNENEKCFSKFWQQGICVLEW